MIGNKKSFYHSQLVEFGPAYVTIKSDVMESKKRRGTYYIVTEHEGDEQFFSIDNDQVKSALEGLKGKSVTLEATGSREDARIKVNGSSSPVESGNMDEQMTKIINLFYKIEQAVTTEHDASKLNGHPVTDESFGGKCAQAFKLLQGFVDTMPTTPLWESDNEVPF